MRIPITIYHICIIGDMHIVVNWLIAGKALKLRTCYIILESFFRTDVVTETTWSIRISVQAKKHRSSNYSKSLSYESFLSFTQIY
jgi:hypothetical protein